MSTFDESKIRRDGEGKFATKGPAAEADDVQLAAPGELDGVVRVAQTMEAEEAAATDPGFRSDARLAKAAADGLRGALPGAQKVVFQGTSKGGSPSAQMIRVEDRSGRTLWQPSKTRESAITPGADLPVMNSQDEASYHGQALADAVAGGHIPTEPVKTWPKKQGIPTRYDVEVDLSTVDRVSRSHQSS